MTRLSEYTGQMTHLSEYTGQMTRLSEYTGQMTRLSEYTGQMTRFSEYTGQMTRLSEASSFFLRIHVDSDVTHISCSQKISDEYTGFHPLFLLLYFYCYIFVLTLFCDFHYSDCFAIFCVNLHCVSALALSQVFRMYMYSIQHLLHIGAIINHLYLKALVRHNVISLVFLLYTFTVQDIIIF